MEKYIELKNETDVPAECNIDSNIEHEMNTKQETTNDHIGKIEDLYEQSDYNLSCINTERLLIPRNPVEHDHGSYALPLNYTLKPGKQKKSDEFLVDDKDDFNSEDDCKSQQVCLTL